MALVKILLVTALVLPFMYLGFRLFVTIIDAALEDHRKDDNKR